MTPVITSPSNPRIKRVRAIAENRKERARSGTFFAEGVHALTAAYRNGWPVEALIYCPETVQTQWARDLIGQTPEDARLEVTPHVQSLLSDREAPSELMGLIAQRQDDLARIPLESGLLVLLLDRPRNPGNLGSMLRSADALGAQGVIISGHATDLYDPKTVRASMGSLFEVPAVRVEAHRALEAWLAAARSRLEGVQVVSTSAHAPRAVYDVDLTRPTVIAIGSEESGVSNYFESLADAFVSIPMFGSATSLNASVAASIFLYEAARQRLARGLTVPRPDARRR